MEIDHETKSRRHGAHVLAVPYPTQGHINPMLQFSKRLVSKGLKATLATTFFITKSINPQATTVHFDTISDGYDEGGFTQAESVETYLQRLQTVGSKTLGELIVRHQTSSHPIDCIVYDSFLPWVLDVAKKFGLVGAAFFTQPCAVNWIYYHVYNGLLKLPISSLPVSLPGLPLLDVSDMPSFIYVPGTYPAYFELVLNQFCNADQAHFVLVNTVYELEAEVVDSMSTFSRLLTIGPTIPSKYLDKRVENDDDYGLNLFVMDPSYGDCIKWLDTKAKGSVVYVSFGSLAILEQDQMVEIAWALKSSNYHFLWVVRETEEAKLPINFISEMGSNEKGVLLKWCPQLEVLANEAIGCFFTHCGWNSTIEALSLGVPMIGMPQWSDQTTNVKLVEDVWNVGVRVKVEKSGIVTRDEIELCIRQVMEGDNGHQMKKNARKWKDMTKDAVDEGGTSDRNIDEFVMKVIQGTFVD